jgi:predicted MFS family arabinose efflux permease
VRGSLSSRRRLNELALATAGMVSTNYVMLGVAALVPLIRRDLAVDGTAVGALAATPFVTAAALSLPAGRLVERWGASRALGASQALAGGAAMTIAVAPSVLALFLGMALYGIAHGIVNPATSVLSAAAVSARHRAFAISVKQTGVTIGGALAGLTLPTVAAATSWRTAAVVAATAGCLVAAWGLATRPADARTPLLLTDRVVRIRRSRLAVYGFAMAGVQLSIFAYATVYLVDEVGVTPRRAGVGLAALLAAGSVGRIAWGLVSDRAHDRVVVLQVAAGASALALAAVPLARGELVWCVLLVIGVCSVGWNGAFHAVVVESAGADGVGRASSFALAFLYAGSIVLPPLLGGVMELGSWGWFWGLTAVGAGVSAAALGTTAGRAARTVPAELPAHS